MKKRLFIFVLTAIFLLTQVSYVEAKGRSRSFSSGSKSFSKSWGGYSGSSKSKSWGGSSTKSSSSSSKSSGSTSNSSGSTSKSSSGTTKSNGGYTGSSKSSRSVPGSFSSNGTSIGGSSTSKSKTSTAKSSYMQDTYKAESSKRNYTTYKQQLNNDQKKVYDSSFSNSYRVNKRMNFEDAMRTRSSRISSFERYNPVRININNYYFGGPLSFGSAFVGPWDLWFLLRASDLFWYHHWHDIYPYRDYFIASEFAQMEQRIRNLEQQNIQRDPTYLDPGTDYDLQLSNDYQERNVDTLYQTNKHSGSNPFATVIVIIIVAGVLIVVIRKVSRPKPVKTFNSRLY